MIPAVETLLDAQRAKVLSWEQIFSDHAPDVHAYAQRLTGNRDDADDLMQETFIRAIPALEKFDEPDVNVRAYLLATCRNTYFRTRARGSRFVSVADVPERAVDDHFVDENPERALLLKEEQEGVRIANARLVPRQRMALALRELEDKSYGEIGELIGVSENAVAQLIYRARSNLRREIRMLSVNTSRLSEECRQLLPELSAFVDGELREPDASRVAEHVDGCDDCREAVGLLGGAAETVRIIPFPLESLLALKLGVDSGLVANGFATPTVSAVAHFPVRITPRNAAIGSSLAAAACAAAIVSVTAARERDIPAAEVATPTPLVSSPTVIDDVPRIAEPEPEAPDAGSVPTTSFVAAAQRGPTTRPVSTPPRTSTPQQAPQPQPSSPSRHRKVIVEVPATPPTAAPPAPPASPPVAPPPATNPIPPPATPQTPPTLAPESTPQSVSEPTTSRRRSRNQSRVERRNRDVEIDEQPAARTARVQPESMEPEAVPDEQPEPPAVEPDAPQVDVEQPVEQPDPAAPQSDQVADAPVETPQT